MIHIANLPVGSFFVHKPLHGCIFSVNDKVSVREIMTVSINTRYDCKTFKFIAMPVLFFRAYCTASVSNNILSTIIIHLTYPRALPLASVVRTKSLFMSTKRKIGGLTRASFKVLNGSCGHGTKAVIQNHKSINE